MKRLLRIAAGMLVLASFLWLLGVYGTKNPPAEREKDPAGVKLTGPTGNPFAGAIKIRISNMGETIAKDTPTHTVQGDVTNNTLVEFEVTSESDVFISSTTEHAIFLDSWGKTIGECYFQVRNIKPHGRNLGTTRVMNLRREKLNGWRLEPEFSSPPWDPKWTSWHAIMIQLAEGSNTVADVTAEVW